MNSICKRFHAAFMALMLVLTINVAGPGYLNAYIVNAEVTNNYPAYTGSAYTILNNNIPLFSNADKKKTSAFETYSELDTYGRCGTAYANICQEIMPTTERGSISSVYPSGWQKNMGWQRCHLIGYQLAGENANKKNLITGTQYFNVSGMLPFENMVDDYVEETGNHVLYRVTPVFKGKELVARGVKMEAWSVEDDGEGICFYVFVHNVAKNKTIDYATGIVTDTGAKLKQSITVKRTTRIYTRVTTAKKFTLGVTTSSGKFYCKKISGSAKLKITRSGKVTVKKNTQAGTYKMRVSITANATDVYKSSTVRRTITVKIRKSSTSTTTKTNTSTINTGTVSVTKVYWTESGTVYHLDRDCRTLANSNNVYSGTISASGKDRACKVCGD